MQQNTHTMALAIVSDRPRAGNDHEVAGGHTAHARGIRFSMHNMRISHCVYRTQAQEACAKLDWKTHIGRGTSRARIEPSQEKAAGSRPVLRQKAPSFYDA